MQSNEVKRFKKFVKDIVDDYVNFVYTIAAISFFCNIIIAIVLGMHIKVHPITALIIVTMLLLTPICGARFLDHEYEVEQDIEDDDY